MRMPHRLVLGPVRMTIGLAADALGRIDAALARAGGSAPAPTPPSTTDSEADDEDIAAVRHARVALAGSHTDLADRLALVEQRLLRQSGSDPLLATADRSASNQRMESIRRQLLANTPRPDETDCD